MSPRILVGVLICCLSGFAFAHSHAKNHPAYDPEHPPKPGDEGVFYGPLIKVIDGDTFTAKVQGVVMKFRLQGVDAPEHNQPYGSDATAALREITKGAQLVLVFDDVDKWGRIVVQAWNGSLEVNAEMVRRGAAWFESEWSDDERLYLMEQQARKQKVGLWALPGRHVEPWVWRKEER